MIGFAAQATSLPMGLGLIVLACVLIGICALAVAPAERRQALATGQV
jgi:hypothetical protein